MTIVAHTTAAPRWERTLRGPNTLDDDLAFIGESVGPRTGPDKRRHGDKEDYVLRRLLVAWKEAGCLPVPMAIRAETERDGEPDFVLTLPNGETRGLEVTEAGEEDYQAWLTRTENAPGAGQPQGASAVPFEASTLRTAEMIKRAIQAKVDKFDRGEYRGTSDCDLVVYDNTAWGGFLDKSELLSEVGRPNQLLGRFRQIHFVTGSLVFLDLFSVEVRSVNIRHSYENDYFDWISSQVERLRRRESSGLDFVHIAEELGDLGLSERRAIRSHLRILMLHLLKWQHQPQRRGQSWSLSIQNARAELHERLSEMPSLRVEFRNRTEREYATARRWAAQETELPRETFPHECPYTPEQLIDPEFFPEGRPQGKS